ncbi:retrovirus-related pol polyprotein from transposon TNT 1-94 [Tanacetum coccineum]
MESQKSFNEYTQKINDLNQTISEMKKELFAHQETISIMSQEKEAQKKFHKTREDKELEKFIALENKIKILDDIFLKKAQRANPRLYDIGCYNVNLALMLALESDEMIHLAQEQIKNDKAFGENQSKVFLKEREQYFEIQDLKAQLQDKGIAISELKKLIEKMKGKSVETKFEKPSVIRQPNAFKSQRQSVLGMYKVHTKPNQTRTPQLPQDIRKTNKRVSFSTRVISTTSVSRPQLKSNRLEDRVMHNNSEGKKQQVEDHRRNFKTKMPMVVPISTRETQANCELLLQILREQLVEIILFIIDSGCSKDMTKKYQGFSKKYHIKRVYYIEGLNISYFSLVNSMMRDLEVGLCGSLHVIIRWPCLKGNEVLSHVLVAQICIPSLFKNTSTPNPICLMAKATSLQAWLWHRCLSHLNFDSINLLSKNDIVFGIPKLKFVKDHLCSSYELWKAKRNSFHTKTTPSSKRRLQLLHMDFCGPMRVESINGKKYVLVIVDDYSRYTWTHFLRSKDKTLEVLIDFLGFV